MEELGEWKRRAFANSDDADFFGADDDDAHIRHLDLEGKSRQKSRAAATENDDFRNHTTSSVPGQM